MTDSRQKMLNKAIECLKLENIVLYESRLRRGTAFPEDVNEILQQNRKNAFMVGESLSEPSFANGEHHKMAAFASFGARLVRREDAENEVEDPEVFIEVEADFILDYTVKDGSIEKDALEVFVDMNVLHNAWPFWRQHLFDVKQRAMLPQFTLGFFPPTEQK